MPASEQNIATIENILASLLGGSAEVVKIIPLDELFAREEAAALAAQTQEETVGEETAPQNHEKNEVSVEDLYSERVVGYAMAIVHLEHDLDWSYLTEEARADFLMQAQLILG